MLEKQKILVTGPAGNIGFPLARELAKHNDVWGISRFGNPVERKKVEDAGITTRAIDLAEGEFGDLPKDFDYVLHIGALIAGNDYDRAIKANAEGTALLMAHCRETKGFLSMSSTGVYKPNPDPWHAFLETDPLGDSVIPGVPTYSLSKLMQEGAVRATARLLGIRTIIARMNAAYGSDGSGAYPGRLFDMIRAGKQVVLRWDPNPYSVIHDRDIYAQTEAMLGAAALDCPIINWGGDEPVSAQQMCAFFGEFLGVKPDVVVGDFPHSQRGVVLDTAKRLPITGPSRVKWQDGFKELAEAHMQRPPLA